MIDLLANLQPIVLIVMLILMYAIENMLPYLSPAPNKKTHYRRNFTISLLSFFLNDAAGPIFVMVVLLKDQKQLGILKHYTTSFDRKTDYWYVTI
jgi:hypothetical protein